MWMVERYAPCFIHIETTENQLKIDHSSSFKFHNIKASDGVHYNWGKLRTTFTFSLSKLKMKGRPNKWPQIVK